MRWLLVVFSGCFVFWLLFLCSLLLKPSVPERQSKLWAAFCMTHIVEKGKPGAVLENSSKPVVKRKDQAPMYLA